MTTRSDVNFYNPIVAGLEELETTFTLFGKAGDVSVNLGGTGANNQAFPDAGRRVTNADDGDPCTLLYNADHIAPHARELGTYVTTRRSGVDVDRVTDAVAIGVAPDATLENPQPDVSWAGAVLHVGAEGLNPNLGELSATSALGFLYDFLTDRVTVRLKHRRTAEGVSLVASASSTLGEIRTYRWDFGDGSPIVETTSKTVTHRYDPGRYTVRVEAVDSLTRSSVATTSVPGGTS